MPSYKLIYFNVTGKAETTRMLFKLGGVDFEDARVSGDEWKAMKEKMPMGQLPVLEVDGTMLCQSNAIARYLAREFGFAGKTSLEMARVDMIVDSIEDVFRKIIKYMEAKTDEEKAEAAKQFLENDMAPGFKKIEAMLEQNEGGDGFFVGKELTFADLNFFTLSGVLVTLLKADLGQFPKLQALCERVKADPRIAAWIKERPESPM